jgi:serine/threonine protein kinase/Tol biopolymer transport system component
MTIAPGTRLGPYEILSRIGEGGMGQVWKARDTRLDRIVAIKTSAAKFSERFEREARAVAALNHPHICTLYDVGPDYLVMEYVEGQEIKGPLPLEQALKLAIQMASALEDAHRKLISHRDLKPANILVTRSGIKILDFGLAKFETAKSGILNEETATQALTQSGAIVGTMQYMAPEQLQAKITDTRADLFSFGCVLYGMLTGTRAFSGANTASLIAAIMERPAPSLGAVAPPALDWVLGRCLAKDPEDRWQTARDLRAALERIETTAVEAQLSKPSRPSVLSWSLAAAAVLAAGALAFIHFRERAPEIPWARFSIAPEAGGRLNGIPPAVSPDGRQIIFSAVSEGKNQLWIRSLDSQAARPLAGTENGVLPFWSPDNKSFAFFAGGKLKKMSVFGGPATNLADASNPRGGTWNSKGVIVFAPTPYSGFRQIAASGGAESVVKTVDIKATSQRYPYFLPDGRHFLYLVGISGQQSTLRIGSVDSPGEDRVLQSDVDSFAVYAPPGFLLFVQGHSLMARPFDAARMAFTGDAVAIADSVRLIATGLWLFGVSENGVLVYQGGLNGTVVTWLDRAGRRLQTVGAPGDTSGVDLSPDQKTVVTTSFESLSGNEDIWLVDLLRGVRTRFTSDPAGENAPVWSPDGKFVVFRSNRSGRVDLYRKALDASGDGDLLYADDLLKTPGGFSHDGKHLAYTAIDTKNGSDIWILPEPLGVPGAAKPYPFLHSEFNEDLPRFSPDGRWVAYQADETGRNEVYIAQFPGAGGKRQISTGGGTRPHWRRDGAELFYLAANGQLTAAELNLKNGSMEVAKILPLFGPMPGFGSYDVTADGQRFIAALPPESEAAEPLTVVQNWTNLLKK